MLICGIDEDFRIRRLFEKGKLMRLQIRLN
jgi:hypothetical protein